MIYLASPYSNPDPAIRLQRYHAACKATAMLVQAGYGIYSPVIHGHPLAEHGVQTDWSFWARHDLPLLEIADAVVVLMLDGWETSVGVRDELRVAKQMGIAVVYLEPVSSDFADPVAHVGPRRNI